MRRTVKGFLYSVLLGFLTVAPHSFSDTFTLYCPPEDTYYCTSSIPECYGSTGWGCDPNFQVVPIPDGLSQSDYSVLLKAGVMFLLLGFCIRTVRRLLEERPGKG